LGVSILACSAAGASFQKTDVRGEYVEARTAVKRALMAAAGIKA
jgi:hypothetical protein